MRSKKSLWPQIEATFKQMDTAATELECFRVLQKQEQLAASHRINNIWSEVEKQKELEGIANPIMQKLYSAGGAPGGAPGGFPGGGAPGGAPGGFPSGGDADGPSVEEVD